MGLRDQVSAERIHIGFFGIRNAGKSGVVNAVTDRSWRRIRYKRDDGRPREKGDGAAALGPVVIIDTPGIDDKRKTGEK